jgi:ABC-type Fe3+-hydroxamate transport system substrate-binding protein
MKQATILEILAGMQREIDELQDRVKALESPVVVYSGGGPGEENNEGGGGKP